MIKLCNNPRFLPKGVRPDSFDFQGKYGADEEVDVVSGDEAPAIVASVRFLVRQIVVVFVELLFRVDLLLATLNWPLLPRVTHNGDEIVRTFERKQRFGLRKRLCELRRRVAFCMRRFFAYLLPYSTVVGHSPVHCMITRLESIIELEGIVESIVAS